MPTSSTVTHGLDAAHRAGLEHLDGVAQRHQRDQLFREGDVATAEQVEHPGPDRAGEDPPVERRRDDSVVEDDEDVGRADLQDLVIGVDQQDVVGGARVGDQPTVGPLVRPRATSTRRGASVRGWRPGSVIASTVTCQAPS